MSQELKAVADLYNLTETRGGGISMTLRSNKADNEHIPVIVIEQYPFRKIRRAKDKNDYETWGGVKCRTQ